MADGPVHSLPIWVSVGVGVGAQWKQQMACVVTPRSELLVAMGEGEQMAQLGRSLDHTLCPPSQPSWKQSCLRDRDRSMSFSSLTGFFCYSDSSLKLRG